MKILGIDPGYGIIGWSVITTSLKIIDYGIIETAPDITLPKRLLKIHHGITAIIEEYRPDQMVMEKLFFKNNKTTASDVTKAIGVMTLAAGRHDLEIYEYTPTQVKQSITGYGQAPKKQIQLMIMKIFNIREIPKPDDAADALAVALCHSLFCTGPGSKGMRSS